MKLVVVGGVAAGASTAARARRLDESAEIIVFERGHHVSFANCGLPYHVGEVIADRDRLLLQTPQSLRDSLNIDVRIGTEVTAIDPATRTVSVREVDTGAEYTETYDALALCPGAAPVRPPLAGIDHPAIEVLRRIGDMDRIKARLDTALAAHKAARRDPVRAVVIGAGYIGLEMAENLHHRGVAVDVVERADQILPPVDREISVPVEQHLRSRGIHVHLSTTAAAFAPLPEDRVGVELNNGTTLPADLVILAAGVRPDTALATAAGLTLGEHGGIAVDTHMRTSDPFIWAAGDAVETPHPVLPGSYLNPLAGPANRQARVAAENICGRTTEYVSTQGTSIVKVFEMVAGGTGATERQLRAAGIDYRAVHVHPSGHAGYYPGTAMMHLKVLFDPADGRILGAQACGFDGIDKRLDLLAMAVRQNMTVHDLEHQELAYAPPFGSAKDPINMAGFVATNVLRGDLRLWYAEDFPAAADGALLIDVRTPDEYGLWHIPGAMNVPLPTLRAAVAAGEWDRDRAGPAVLRGGLPVVSGLPHSGAERLLRCRDALGRFHHLQGGSRPSRGHLRGTSAGGVLRRSRVRRRGRRQRNADRPGLHRIGLPGSDHEAVQGDGRPHPRRRGPGDGVRPRFRPRRPGLGVEERPPAHRDLPARAGLRGHAAQGRGGGHHRRRTSAEQDLDGGVLRRPRQAHRRVHHR